MLFDKIKFTNCVTKVPGGSCYTGYGEYEQKINKKIKPSQLKYNTFNSMEIIKPLFNKYINPVITDDLSVKQYNLKITNINCKKSFADLFKKYIKYNCYIETNDSKNYKISDLISDEVTKYNKKYKVSNDCPLEQAIVNLDNEQDIYIQVKGNNVKRIKLINNKNSNTIHVYNEWLKFGWIIITENISNIIQEYSRINKKYTGKSLPILSNEKLNYTFKRSGILDLNNINTNKNKTVEFKLNKITVGKGISKTRKNKVIGSRHQKSKHTNIYLNNLEVNKNSVLKFDRGVKLTLGKSK